MRLFCRISCFAFALVAIAGAGWSADAAGQTRGYANEGLSRRYSPHEAAHIRNIGNREPVSYSASRRSWDPYTPYYSRPAVWPYYPRYYGSWYYGPYGYRYGFSPWFSSYGRYTWPNAWRIAELGPVPIDGLNFPGRVPFAPYDPPALISPTDIGRGIPAAWTADPVIECYYW